MSRVVVALLIAVLARAQSTGTRQPAAELKALEESLQREVNASPTAAKWEKLGLIRHLQNRFEEAVPAFRQALQLNPSLWTSHLFLGIGLYRTNQFGPALESLQKADKLVRGAPPGRDDIDYWLAATNAALKRPLAALRALEALLQRNPKHTEALELAVRTYTDLSTGLWNEVADKHFGTAAGYEIHGHALESEGNRKGAMEAFRHSQQMGPGRAGPGLAVARLLLMDGKAAEALEQLEREMRLADADPATYYYAGIAAIELARYPEAADYLERAAAWTSRNPEAPLALAQVYLALDQPAKAAAAARKAVALDPSSAVAQDLLISALERSGAAEEAATERTRRRQP